MMRLHLAARVARRELRGGLLRFGVFLTCLALGVAAVAAVGEVAAIVDNSLRVDAKAILGGDLAVTRSHIELDQDAQDWLSQRGEVSRLARLRTMVRAADQSKAEAAVQRSMLSELKAVGQAYPLYGAVKLQGGGDFHQALANENGKWGAVVDSRVLARLGLEVGDDLIIGKSRFTIRAILEHEPDKAAQFFGLGPRVFVNIESLPATGLLAPGTVVYYVYKLKLFNPPPAGAPRANEQVKALAQEFRDTFGQSGARVRDYTQSGRSLRRFMDTLQRYLLLVGLISLLVGGIGVANGVRSYLETKSRAIATMKCLGAERSTIYAAYLFQVLFLALAGSAMGLIGGLIAARVAAEFLFRTLGLSMDAGAAFFQGLAVLPLAGGLGFGLLTALLFAVWPLERAGKISPARLFRGYADPRGERHGYAAWLIALAVLVLMLILAWGMTRDLPLVLGFAGGALAGAALFRLAAWGLMRLAAIAPKPRRIWLRQAIGNLHRPGARTPDVIFSLGLGLSALAGVALIDGNMLTLINQQMPEQAPTYFFIDIPKDRITAFRDAIEAIPGVSRFESEPSLRGRIVDINGTPVEKANVSSESAWAIRSERGLTFAAKKPDKVNIVAGEWWPPDYSGPPLMCFTKGLADGFGIGVGDTLTINILGRNVTATIASLREVEWTTLALNHAVMFSPGVLEKAPYSYIATVYSKDGHSEDVSAVQDPVFDLVVTEFPEVTAIYIKDVLRDVSAIFDAIGLAVRSTAAVTLLAGLLVLAETLRATLRSRYYEAVLFKVLGATRWDIVRALATEFILMGAGTALLAALLGSAISWAFIHFVMHGEWRFLPLPLAVVCIGGVIATLGLGMLGIRSVLGRKAWPVLRNE